MKRERELTQTLDFLSNFPLQFCCKPTKGYGMINDQNGGLKSNRNLYNINKIQASGVKKVTIARGDYLAYLVVTKQYIFAICHTPNQTGEYGTRPF